MMPGRVHRKLKRTRCGEKPWRAAGHNRRLRGPGLVLSTRDPSPLPLEATKPLHLAEVPW
jgi:hypothetical protein